LTQENDRHRFNRLQFYTIVFAFLSVAMTFIIFSSIGQANIICPVGQAVGSIGSTNDTCVVPLANTGPIVFVQRIFKNDTNGISVASLTTNSWTPLQNETLVVVTSESTAFAKSQVSSVTDLRGDVFTLRLRQEFVPGTGDLELWTGTEPATVTPNSVTVNWNESLNPHLVQIVRYQNIAGFGTAITRATSTQGQFNGTLSITTTQSGSWVFGTTSVLSLTINPVLSPCPGTIISSGTGFVRRADDCSTPFITDGAETEVADNSTTLRNGIVVSYSPLINNNTPWVESIAVEMFAVDQEPSHQVVDTSILCHTTGDTCHINSADRISGINTLQVLLPNTAYCTGITTGPLVTTSTQLLRTVATYAALSTNITGAKLLIQVYVSTSVPSTSFGAGLCAAGSVSAPGTIWFQTSGANAQYNVNYYATTMYGSISEVPGTYYAFIEITPQNFAGHLSMAQWGLRPNSQLMIEELR
jgi:hypothetical protein